MIFSLLSLLSLFFGGIAVMAFAPFGYYLLAEGSLVFLLLLWSRIKSAKESFWYGWLFGIGFFGCGVYWVYISIHDHGHAPIPLSVLILALFVAFLALYPAVQGYFLNRFYPQNDWRKFLLAFPASLVVLEWIRGWLLSGFPWLFFGYSHIDSFLCGWAKFFGVYGVSFLVAQTAAIIVYLFYQYKKPKIIAGSIAWLFVIWGGGYWLTQLSWCKQIGSDVQVSLIQGNIPLVRKWNENEVIPILNTYIGLSEKNLSSKIIVWPEAAITDRLESVDFYLKQFSASAKKHDVTILSGIPFYEIATNHYYNGIISFGANFGRYYKRNLVPFGEYLPLRFILSWLHDYIMIPMADFTSGSNKQPDLLVGNIVIAPFVCYEIAYANLVLEYLPKAALLVTVSDDSWFGRSIASAQHLEIARMRSLEVGRSQLLAANCGITAVIDENGNVVLQAPEFTQTVLTTKTKMLTGATPWVSFGRYVWLPSLLIILLCAKINYKRKEGKRKIKS